jgi:hypothetical protein
MDHATFNEIFYARVEACEQMLIVKGREYATEDRLHNFRVAAELQNGSPRSALGGMLAKHIVSIFDLLPKEELAPLEVWNEKIGDALNYLFLLNALVMEEHESLRPTRKTQGVSDAQA